MKDQVKIKQKHKNIICYLISASLIGISILLYQLSDSYIGMSIGADKVISAMDNPIEIRAKYSDSEKYMEAIEKLLLNSLKKQNTEWQETKKIYFYLFKILLFIGVFQIGVLLWPVKKSD